MKNKVVEVSGDPNGSYDIFFWGILIIYAIEYIGIGNYIPGIQKITLYLSLSIFIAVFFFKSGYEVLRYPQTKAFLVFMFHTGLSISYALVTLYAFNSLKKQIGYIVLYISTYLVLTNVNRIHLFIKFFTLAHIFLIYSNFDKFGSDERNESFTAGYFLGNGNDFAWSLIIFLPFILYLYHCAQSKIYKIFLIGGIVLFAIGIVGTSSRGAFLGIVVAIVYLVFNSRKKVRSILIVAIVSLLAFPFVSAHYIERIQTISTYEEDSSALGRIMAWQASMRMAAEHPLGVGAGNFNSAYGRFYRPNEVDPRVWRPDRWISPHSIYFLVLGEYGIIGLITIILLAYFNFRDNQRLVRRAKADVEAQIAGVQAFRDFPGFINMSLIAYLVGGIFLGGVNYPHFYVITALSLGVHKLLVDGTEIQKSA